MQPDQLRDVLLEVMDSVAPGCLPQDIDDDADIREQMDLDSMDLLNIVAALQWALLHGSRSGRSAQQFARDWAGQQQLNQ